MRARPRGGASSMLFAVLSVASPLAAQQQAGVCAAVAALLPPDTGQLTLTRDTLVRDPRSRQRLPGCVVRLAVTRAALGDAPPPDQRIREGLGALGWRENLQYSADGPDGTAFAFWLGTATCFVEARWDGGDDADPASSGSDDYRLMIGCTVEP